MKRKAASSWGHKSFFVSRRCMRWRESGMENVGGRRLRQGKTKKSAKEHYYQRAFRRDEVVEFLI